MAEQHRPTGRPSRALVVRIVGCAVVVLTASSVPWAHALLADSASVSTSVETAVLEPPSGLAVSYTCTPPTTIVLRGTATDTGSGSLTVATPVGTRAGDVLVAQVANRNGAAPLTAPGGWTLIRRDTWDPSTVSAAVTSALYWRLATSAEPVSATFTLAGSNQMAGGIAAYGGVKASAPVDVSAARTGYSATVTTPSVTTSKPGAMLVHALTKRQQDLPAPAGTAQRWRLYSGSGTGTLGATVGDELFAGPGATAPRSASDGTFAAEWVAQTVALRPIPGTPTASLTWTGTPTPWATGHRLERTVGGAVEATKNVTPRPANSTTDGPLTNDTAYTFALSAYYRSWTSTPVTAGLTPSC